MSIKVTSSQLETLLIDVRRAYRLLYTFQRRVLDIMQYIGDLTSRRYEGGWSKFSDSSPRNGKGYLESWAWDWLNLYCYEFYFGDKLINDSLIRFSVWLVSDTGFYDSEAVDKKNIESFSRVEDSSTKLVFVIGKNIWHTEFKDFQTNLKKESQEDKRENEKGVLLVKSFNLASFINADETRVHLKQLIEFCHSNGIEDISVIDS